MCSIALVLMFSSVRIRWLSQDETVNNDGTTLRLWLLANCLSV